MNSVGNNVQQFVIAFPQFSLAANPLQRATNETHIAHSFCTVLLWGKGGGSRRSFLKGEIHKLNFQRLLSDFVRAVAVDLTGGIVVYLHTAHTHTNTHTCCATWAHDVCATHTDTQTHTLSLWLPWSLLLLGENHKNKLVACNLIWNARAFIKQNENCEMEMSQPSRKARKKAKKMLIRFCFSMPRRQLASLPVSPVAQVMCVPLIAKLINI